MVLACLGDGKELHELGQGQGIIRGMQGGRGWHEMGKLRQVHD